MATITLSASEYKDKVHACWLGKNIGGTLGTPFEGSKHVNDLDFFRPVPRGSAANDDLDLQLVWLKLLEDKGVDPSLDEFSEYWIKYLSAYPWNEYGMCRRNLERGLRPPISGAFQNYFVDEMGSPIRSELWACVAPGDPQLAATMAWKDSILDHAGGEGTHGEMFWAAVESAAFVVKDPDILIRIGLAMIPTSCLISRVIREALWCYKNKLSWAEARNRIVTYFPSNQHCNAVPNHGFIILGWLYGQDFGDKLCKAVNCGYDTDCTGATLGSLLGILGGTMGVSNAWKLPIGGDIVLHKFTGKFNSPKTVEDLTDRTAALARKVLDARSSTVKIGSKTDIPKDGENLLFQNDLALAALQRDVQSATARVGDLDITFHYGGDPILLNNINRTVRVSVVRNWAPVVAKVEIKVPKGFKKKDLEKSEHTASFSIVAKTVPDTSEIKVEVKTPEGKASASFVILGPNEGNGFPAGECVRTCAACGAREEGCICAP